jgi:hypothetical protein
MAITANADPRLLGEDVEELARKLVCEPCDRLQPARSTVAMATGSTATSVLWAKHTTTSNKHAINLRCCTPRCAKGCIRPQKELNIRSTKQSIPQSLTSLVPEPNIRRSFHYDIQNPSCIQRPKPHPGYHCIATSNPTPTPYMTTQHPLSALNSFGSPFLTISSTSLFWLFCCWCCPPCCCCPCPPPCCPPCCC